MHQSLLFASDFLQASIAPLTAYTYTLTEVVLQSLCAR
jgi:hypothetical protein